MGTRMVISVEECERLIRRDIELELLDAAGVDNWTWYGEHWNILAEDFPGMDSVEEMLDIAVANRLKQTKAGK